MKKPVFITRPIAALAALVLFAAVVGGCTCNPPPRNPGPHPAAKDGKDIRVGNPGPHY